MMQARSGIVGSGSMSRNYAAKLPSRTTIPLLPFTGYATGAPTRARSAQVTRAAAPDEASMKTVLPATGRPKLSLQLQLPELKPESKQHSTAAWNDWMGQELADKLVGVTAGTSRAQVRTVGVKSASVNKGLIRAEQLDVLLELEGLHKKEAGKKMSGVVRICLKTKDKKDHISMSDAVWNPGDDSTLSQQVQDEIMAVADMPLESALAIRLNDILWDVERRSIDGSLDEA